VQGDLSLGQCCSGEAEACDARLPAFGLVDATPGQLDLHGQEMRSRLDAPLVSRFEERRQEKECTFKVVAEEGSAGSDEPPAIVRLMLKLGIEALHLRPIVPQEREKELKLEEPSFVRRCVSPVPDHQPGKLLLPPLQGREPGQVHHRLNVAGIQLEGSLVSLARGEDPNTPGGTPVEVDLTELVPALNGVGVVPKDVSQQSLGLVVPLLPVEDMGLHHLAFEPG
jgi:hypothetical protein